MAAELLVPIALCILCCRYGEASDLESLRYMICSQMNHSFESIHHNFTINMADDNNSSSEIFTFMNLPVSNTSDTEFNIDLGCSSNYSIGMAQDPLAHLKFYLSGIGCVAVCILGCAGNLMSMFILVGRMYTSSTNMYLLALAVADICMLVFAMLLSLSDILWVTLPLSQSAQMFKAYTFPYIHPLANTFHTISIWITVAFTIDRYIMICHPFKGNRYCTRSKAVTVVLCLYIFGIIYNLPKFFEYKTVVHLFRGKLFFGQELTQFGNSWVFLNIVNLGTYVVFIFIVPCVTLAVLNYKLIVAVIQSRLKGRRLSLGATGNHRNDTTVMLAAVVVVFLVCQIPALVSNTIWAWMTDEFVKGDKKFDHLRIIREVSNFLVILNSAVNVFLYYAFSPKFREAFKLKFCAPCLDSQTRTTLSYSRRPSCQSARTTLSSYYRPCNQDDDLRSDSKNSSKRSSSDSSSNSMVKTERKMATRGSTVSFSTITSTDGNYLKTTIGEHLPYEQETTGSGLTSSPTSSV